MASASRKKTKKDGSWKYILPFAVGVALLANAAIIRQFETINSKNGWNYSEIFEYSKQMSLKNDTTGATFAVSSAIKTP